MLKNQILVPLILDIVYTFQKYKENVILKIFVELMSVYKTILRSWWTWDEIELPLRRMHCSLNSISRSRMADRYKTGTSKKRKFIETGDMK